MSDIAAEIEQSGAIKRGQFQLSDGTMTDYYIDKYVFETRPLLLKAVRNALIEHLDEQSFQIVAGPALGAVPIVTAVSLELGVDAVFVRKSTGLRGTQARIEGDVDKGKRAIIIEDVTMTGKTAIESAQILEAAGGIVEAVVAVVDRDEGAGERVREAGYDFDSVLQVGTDLAINQHTDSSEENNE